MRTIVSMFFAVIFIAANAQVASEESLFRSNILPVRGFCIAAPRSAAVSDFIKFVENELSPRSVNTLILRVDWNYDYQSHPELSDSGALTKEDVKKIVYACKKHNIRIIPQVNLLGHQSWANRTGNLLKAYPEFDETPNVKMPEKYVWPNADGLYCKSYCPLHPEVHEVVFGVMDEICDAFEADASMPGWMKSFTLEKSNVRDVRVRIRQSSLQVK